MKSVLAACTLLVVTSASAVAEDGSSAIGLSGGVTVPIGSFNDAYDPGPGFGLWLKSGITDDFDWRLEIGYDMASASTALEDACAQFGRDCGSSKVKRYTLGAYYNIPGGGSTMPYVYVNGGIYNQELQATEAIAGVFDLDITNSESGFGFNFGVGADWNLGDGPWLVGLDLRMNGLMLGEQDNWYFSPTVHIAVGF